MVFYHGLKEAESNRLTHMSQKMAKESLKHKCREGPEIAEKFEQAMKLLFRTPKTDVSSDLLQDLSS